MLTGGLFSLAVLFGCAVASQPALLRPISTAQSEAIVIVARDVDFRLDTGYTRHLQAGSQWVSVGTLMQGTVYKSRKGVFSVEGSNVHEAYLVVDGNRLSGFYLPAERAFSALSGQVQVILQAREAP